ncbi:MAG: hypothetical protein OK441_04840 [Thaumarchaeota archaeon]|nr:hypothetical protein [Nitrososphaerota archaeon]
MAGVNVDGDLLRESPKWVAEILARTPIKWLRIHTLPTRSLDQKGPGGLSYLDAIEYVCRSGLNIITPVDVGYTEVVGSVPRARLDAFIEESYGYSSKAAKLIAETAARYDVEAVFGIENEIDMKSWIMQSLPGVAWRESSETWIAFALNSSLKYQRLNNILRGVKDAVPSARTMINVSAADAEDLLGLIRRRPRALPAQRSALETLSDKMVDWKVELERVKERLDVDLVGIDTYPNYFLKFPIMGKDTANKVAQAAAISGKPVLNPEFGYSIYRSLLERLSAGLLLKPSASRMQLEFFRNTLTSIETSLSVGTFPWLLMTQAEKIEVPRQESYFGLFQMHGRTVRKQPAFDYYIDWLQRRNVKN